MSFTRRALVLSLAGLAWLAPVAGPARAADGDQPPAAAAPVEAVQASPEDVAAIAEAQQRTKEFLEAGNFPEALLAAEQAVVKTEQVLGPDHPKVAAMLNNLGGVYRARMDAARTGYVKSAGPVYERALLICEAKFGPEHPTVAAVLTNLSQVYKAEARYADAELLAKRALDIWKRLYGPNDPRVAIGYNHLADLYRNQGRFKEAEAAYNDAMLRFHETLGPGHPMAEDALDDLTEIMAMAEREKAMPEQPVSTLLEAPEPEDVDKGSAAESSFRWKLDAMETTLGPNHPNVATLVASMGDYYLAKKRYEEAESAYKRALSIDENAYGPVHERVAKDLHRLTGLYRAQERWADAEPLYARLIATMEQILDKNHPDVLKTLDQQAACLEALGKSKDAKAVRDRLSAAEREVKR